MSSKQHACDTDVVPQGLELGATGAVPADTQGDLMPVEATGARPADASKAVASSAATGSLVARGLCDQLHPQRIRQLVRITVLVLAHRMRVIRTLDAAVRCFPERSAKAAMTAAQRAIGSLVTDGLLRRYRTDRQQTVYGLTQRGANELHDAGRDASASVRRVSEMTNPEHRLWSQLFVLAAEARGLRAWTEPELLQRLSKPIGSRPAPRELMQIPADNSLNPQMRSIRPDALIVSGDGATWIEIDRSARGSQRAHDLWHLVLSVGARLSTGEALRRVVIAARTPRIRRRVLATLHSVVEVTARQSVRAGTRQVRRIDDGLFQVWLVVEERCRRGHSTLVHKLAGHVVVQELPVALPAVGTVATERPFVAPMPQAWLNEFGLPYRQTPGETPWPALVSPLLKMAANGVNAGDC